MRKGRFSGLLGRGGAAAPDRTRATLPLADLAAPFALLATGAAAWGLGAGPMLALAATAVALPLLALSLSQARRRSAAAAERGAADAAAHTARPFVAEFEARGRRCFSGTAAAGPPT